MGEYEGLHRKWGLRSKSLFDDKTDSTMTKARDLTWIMLIHILIPERRNTSMQVMPSQLMIDNGDQMNDCKLT